MATGSGLSSSVGFATESTYGTPVAVNRFFEFDSESVQAKKTSIFGTGLRGGAYTAAASRRSLGTRTVDGDINLDAPGSGLGILLFHMLGTPTVTPTSLGGGLYQQIHTPGSLNGRSFTTQIVRAATDGDLTTATYTYPGCKITEWEFSCQTSQTLKLKLQIAARDEATPSNSFANTTLSASVAVGATSISTVGSVPAGAYISLNTGGSASEIVKVSTVTGSGPYTVNLAAGFLPTQAHASGAVVGSATGINYGAVTALQTPTYSATRTLFTFVQGSLVAGGTTTNTSGVLSNTGGRTIGNVHSITLTGTTPMKTDRFGLGTSLVSEPIENGWRAYTGEAEIELNDRTLYDAYASEGQLDMQLTFVNPSGATLQFIIPAAFQDDGANPVVGGPDVITIKPKFSFLDDGVNGPLQVIYISTDAAL